MKYLKWFLLLLLAAVIVVVFLNYERLDIVSGYSAKSMASSVFTAKRGFQFTDSTDNNFSPINIAKDEIDLQEKSATASVFGLNKRKAIYREGLGSVLIPDGYKYTPDNIKPKRNFTKIELPYPYGNLEQKDTVFANVDYKKLQSVIDTYSQDSLQTRALLVIYKDQIIAETYAKGFNKDSRILGWSMTKSITSTIYGVLQSHGEIDVMQPAPIDAWKDDERNKITINNLLQMNSGLEWEENYETISDVTKMLFQEEDMTSSQADEPLVGKPNESWYYSSGTTNLLSGILRKQFNSYQEYLDFWYTDLIDKIGMHSMLIEADMIGNYVGSSYGWASPRDWAKLGLLYLHQGNWNGAQIFTKDWYDYAVTPTNSSNGRYGAQIWLNAGGFLPDVPRDVFSFNGYQGQRVYMCPSKDLVVVRMGLKPMDFNGLLRDVIEVIN
ncbi:serine hydrolase domain-containing protein [Pontimicrobium aquaticum]|uniref:Serine hydrolase n=1 Tax=Pontimicrobium aquaticum TaxID=2565367 RepID=A0A4U0F114_9FLAO|nr:serine hydrolase [Pontimicrobium aquaticum]TJY38086.1 serine hydrolase [Pontimicrobium aquaticum]